MADHRLARREKARPTLMLVFGRAAMALAGEFPDGPVKACDHVASGTVDEAAMCLDHVELGLACRLCFGLHNLDHGVGQVVPCAICGDMDAPRQPIMWPAPAKPYRAAHAVWGEVTIGMPVVLTGICICQPCGEALNEQMLA